MKYKEYIKPAISLLMLVSGMMMTANDVVWFQSRYITLIWYIVAYLPVGIDVMREAWEYILKKDFFSEFTLMTIATLGAFAIGEYPEGVAVMLFYSIGELFQDKAVERARNNIKSLVAFRPDKAVVIDSTDVRITKSPEEVSIGDVIEVKPGERVPLDGMLVSADSSFNTAALTGESVPRLIQKDNEVLAGMISSDCIAHIRVTRKMGDSAISRILRMVEEATERKAPAELFIRRFARIYTPSVICLAVLTVLVPWIYSFVSADFKFLFSEWFYRALIFLVISCPCALVISIPLGYFGGIGAASSRGILFKGSNYLDAITHLDTIVFDKTGTLTTGCFAVSKVFAVTISEKQLIDVVASLERGSNHPIAKAIVAYAKCDTDSYAPQNMKDIPGYGLSADVDGRKVLVGTFRLLDKEGVHYPQSLRSVPETIVACSIDGIYAGYVLLSDTLKKDSPQAVRVLNTEGYHTEILSGDKQALVDKVASELKVDKGIGDLLPDGKVKHIDSLRKSGHCVAFVGDGINDAPVLALSDVGIAMGGLGSDMAIETADVVIRNDKPSRIIDAIHIGKHTLRIVHENIILAIGVKLAVMVLGVLGVANLWEAVFADVGVALIAVLNATRIFLRKS